MIPVFYALEEEAENYNDDLVISFYENFKREFIEILNYEQWNYYYMKKHYTNNACKAYHNHLNQIIGIKKPYFWLSINILYYNK